MIGYESIAKTATRLSAALKMIVVRFMALARMSNDPDLSEYPVAAYNI